MTNRSRLSNFTYRALVGSLTVAFLGGGCTAKKLPAYPTHPVSAYRYTQVKDGLAVAISPLFNPQESETYFDTDLVSRGIVAVLVRVENQSAPSTFLVLKERFALRTGQREESQVSGREQIKPGFLEDALQVGNQLGAGGGQGALLLVPLIPVFIVAEKMHVHEERVRRKLLIEEFQTKTISPGEETHGFVYFPLPSGQPRAGQWTLHMEVQDLQSQEVNPFDFVFEGK